MFNVSGTMIVLWLDICPGSPVLQPSHPFPHSLIPKCIIYWLFFFFFCSPAGQIQVKSIRMYLKCQKALAVLQRLTHRLPSHSYQREGTRFSGKAFLIQLGEQGTERENISLCGVCLPLIILFRFPLGGVE